LALSLLVALFCIRAEAQQAGSQDVIYLKNGNIVRGTITERIPGERVTIETRDGSVFTFKFEEIERITREKARGGERGGEPTRARSAASGDYMSKGRTYVGPSVGFSFLGSVPNLGGNVEYALDQNIGVGGLIRYWSYSQDLILSKYSYSNILIAGQANYHFRLGVDKLDPYVGIILGYDIQSVTLKSGTGKEGVSGSGFVATPYGAVRYFFRDNMAFVARFGYGTFSYGALEVGLDFRL